MIQKTIKDNSMDRRHVLLVDDEESNVKFAKQLLERLGYEVSGRTSSIEALQAFRAQPDKFDLVITDMSMPSLTGLDLSKEVFGLRRDIPIILCRGFDEAVDVEKANKVGIRAILMKPILAKDLSTAILKVFDKGEGKNN